MRQLRHVRAVMFVGHLNWISDSLGANGWRGGGAYEGARSDPRAESISSRALVFASRQLR